MKKTIRNDYCIRMFTGSDNIRPAQMNVHLENGFLYATNSHIAAKIDQKLCMQTYSKIDTFPDIEKILSEHESKEIKTCKIDSLFTDLMKIECCFRPKKIECTECDGEGERTCDHCDSEYECKKCHGEGDIDGEELELSGEHDCKLFNRYYQLSNIDKVLKTAIILNIDEIEISNAINNGGTIFKVGDFEILLMTKLPPK